MMDSSFLDMKVKKGDIVKIEYTGTFEDGREFDSNVGKEPLEVEVGVGRVIKGFDQALEGMEKGEEKTMTIPPEEAYGPRDEKLEQALPKDKLPKDIPYKPGVILNLKHKNGQMIMAIVKDVIDDKVLIDLNHPLAGKKLTFKIKILDITKDKA
jgi:peptidylprolyl isomerase